MKTTIQFTSQIIDDMFAANYFGDDAYAQDIQKLWIRRMHELGFELGQSYDSDRFDAACDAAMAGAVQEWNNIAERDAELKELCR